MTASNNATDKQKDLRMTDQKDEFQAIRDLGLEVHDGAVHYPSGGHQETVVLASDLLKLLNGSKKMYGTKYTNDPYSINEKCGPNDTHSGLLIGYKEIEKPAPVKVEELITTLRLVAHKCGADQEKIIELCNLADKYGTEKEGG